MVVIASYTRLAIVSCTTSFIKLNNYINCLTNIFFSFTGFTIRQRPTQMVTFEVMPYGVWLTTSPVISSPVAFFYYLLIFIISKIAKCTPSFYLIPFKINICVWFSVLRSRCSSISWSWRRQRWKGSIRPFDEVMFLELRCPKMILEQCLTEVLVHC